MRDMMGRVWLRVENSQERIIIVTLFNYLKVFHTIFRIFEIEE